MQDTNPFPGPMVISQTPWLTGRGDILRQIKDAIDQRDAHDPAVLFIVGSSGMGKSSLLEAGVLNNTTLFPDTEYQRLKIKYEIDYDSKEKENEKEKARRKRWVGRRTWEWLCRWGKKEDAENENEEAPDPWFSFQNITINPGYSPKTTRIELRPNEDPDTLLWSYLHRSSEVSDPPRKHIYILDNFEAYFQWPSSKHLTEGERLIRGLDPIFRDTYPNADPQYRKQPHNRNYFFIVALRSEQFAIVSQYFPGLGAYSIFLHGLGKADAYAFIRTAGEDEACNPILSEAPIIVSHSLREGSIFSHEVDPFILSISCYIAYERKLAAARAPFTDTNPPVESSVQGRTVVAPPTARAQDVSTSAVLSFVRNAIRKFTQGQTPTRKTLPPPEQTSPLKRTLHACLRPFLAAASGIMNTVYEFRAWRLERTIIRRFLRFEPDIGSISVDADKAKDLYFSKKSLENLTKNCILKKIDLSAKESVYRLYHYRIAQAMGSAELERRRRLRVWTIRGVPLLVLAASLSLWLVYCKVKDQQLQRERTFASIKFPLELREARFVSDLREDPTNVRRPTAVDNYHKARQPYERALTGDSATRANAINRLGVTINEKKNLALWRLLGGWEEAARSQFDVISGLEWVRKDLAALVPPPIATPATSPPPAAEPSNSPPPAVEPSTTAPQAEITPPFTLQNFQTSLLSAYKGSKIYPSGTASGDSSSVASEEGKAPLKDDRIDLPPSEFDESIHLENVWGQWHQLGSWLEKVKDHLASGGNDTALIASIDQFLTGYAKEPPESQAQIRVNVTALAARLAALDFKFRAQLRLWSGSYDSSHLSALSEGLASVKEDIETADSEFKIKADAESIESVVAIRRQTNALHLVRMRIQRIDSAVAALKDVIAGKTQQTAAAYDLAHPMEHHAEDGEDLLEENRNESHGSVEIDPSDDTLIPTDMGFALASAVGKFLPLKRNHKERQEQWYWVGVKKSKDKEKWGWGPFQAAIMVQDTSTWEKWHDKMKDATAQLCANGAHVDADATSAAIPEKTDLAWYLALNESVRKAEKELDSKHLTAGFQAFKDSVSHFQELLKRQKEEESKNAAASFTGSAFHAITQERLLYLAEVIRNISASLSDKRDTAEAKTCEAALRDWNALPEKARAPVVASTTPILQKQITALQKRRTEWAARPDFASLPAWYTFALHDEQSFKDEIKIQQDCMTIHKALDQGLKPGPEAASLAESVAKITAPTNWSACFVRALAALTQHRIDTEEYLLPAAPGTPASTFPFQNKMELEDNTLGKEFIRLGHLAVLSRSLEWWLNPWEGPVPKDPVVWVESATTKNNEGPNPVLTDFPARFQQEHCNLLFACASQYYHVFDGNADQTLKKLSSDLSRTLSPELNYRFPSQKTVDGSEWIKIPQPASAPASTSYPVMSVPAISARLCLRMAAEVPGLISPVQRSKWMSLLFEKTSPSVSGSTTKRYDTCQFEATLGEGSFDLKKVPQAKLPMDLPLEAGESPDDAVKPQAVFTAWKHLLKGRRIPLAQFSNLAPLAFYRLGYSAELNQMIAASVGKESSDVDKKSTDRPKDKEMSRLEKEVARLQKTTDFWSQADKYATSGWKDDFIRRYGALDKLVNRGTHGFTSGMDLSEQKILEVQFHVWCLANSSTIKRWPKLMVPFKGNDEELSALMLRFIGTESGKFSPTVQNRWFESMSHNQVQQAFTTMLKKSKSSERENKSPPQLKNNWEKFWFTIGESRWHTSASPKDLEELKSDLGKEMVDTPQSEGQKSRID